MSEFGSSLVCRVASRWCALPLEHVIEAMRPLPVRPLAGVPPFVRGVAIVRGEPVPVIDLAQLLTDEPSTPQRFVCIRAGARRLVLAVDAVVCIRTLPADSTQGLQPLLRDSAAAAVASLGTLDAELLVVLESSRLVPESVWAALERSAA